MGCGESRTLKLFDRNYNGEYGDIEHLEIVIRALENFKGSKIYRLVNIEYTPKDLNNLEPSQKWIIKAQFIDTKIGVTTHSVWLDKNLETHIQIGFFSKIKKKDS